MKLEKHVYKSLFAIAIFKERKKRKKSMIEIYCFNSYSFFVCKNFDKVINFLLD